MPRTLEVKWGHVRLDHSAQSAVATPALQVQLTGLFQF